MTGMVELIGLTLEFVAMCLQCCFAAADSYQEAKATGSTRRQSDDCKKDVIATEPINADIPEKLEKAVIT